MVTASDKTISCNCNTSKYVYLAENLKGWLEGEQMALCHLPAPPTVRLLYLQFNFKHQPKLWYSKLHWLEESPSNFSTGQVWVTVEQIVFQPPSPLQSQFFHYVNVTGKEWHSLCVLLSFRVFLHFNGILCYFTTRKSSKISWAVAFLFWDS